MKHIRTILAAAGLVVVVTSGTAKADEEGTKLFTSAARGTEFHWTIVNVSAKPLRITTSVIGAGDGLTLDSSGATTVLPGTEGGDDFFTTPKPDGSPNPTDGYCKFEVSGTGDRNRVRAILGANLLRNIPGTTAPIFLSRILEAR